MLLSAPSGMCQNSVCRAQMGALLCTPGETNPAKLGREQGEVGFHSFIPLIPASQRTPGPQRWSWNHCSTQLWAGLELGEQVRGIVHLGNSSPPSTAGSALSFAAVKPVWWWLSCAHPALGDAGRTLGSSLSLKPANGATPEPRLVAAL